MKFLILLLTSSKFDLLLRCIESIKNQTYKLDYDIKIIVNTKNDKYYEYVKENIKDYEVIRTPSNGYPGKGHNSLYHIFNNTDNYDYMIPMDGDDLLYPSAFEQYSKFIKYNPDIIHTMINDHILKGHTHKKYYELNYGYKLITTFGIDSNFFKTDTFNKLGNPFIDKVYNCITPTRIILISKKLSKMKLIHYGEDLTLYDDMTAFLDTVNIHLRHKEFKAFLTSESNIYFYDKLNEGSATQNFAKEDKELEDKKIKTYIKKFDYTWEDVKNIDFLSISKPKSFTQEDKHTFCNKLVDKDFIEYLRKAKKDTIIGKKFLDEMKYYDFDILKNIIINDRVLQDRLRFGDILLNLEPIEENYLMMLKIVQENNINIKVAEYINMLNYINPAKYINIARYENKINKNDKPILCYYVGESKSFNGKDYHLQSVWGSEIAAIKLCESLTYKYDVYIINNTSEEIEHKGVKYIHFNNFNSFLHNNTIDRLIISRFTHAFLIFDLENIKQIDMIFHDTRCHEQFYGEVLDNLGIPLFMNNYKKLNKIICVSEWQKNNFLKILDALKFDKENIQDKIIILPNGIDKNNKNINFQEKDLYRFIYHSDPSRGLLKLCNILIKLQKIYTNVKLDIYYSHIADTEILELINKYDFINFRGKVSNNKIRKELSKTTFWVYPNINSHETFCISCLEAMTEGNVILTLNGTGISELVGQDGFLFNKEDNDEKYIELLNKLINDKKLRKEYQEKSISKSKDFYWENIAKLW